MSTRQKLKIIPEQNVTVCNQLALQQHSLASLLLNFKQCRYEQSPETLRYVVSTIAPRLADSSQLQAIFTELQVTIAAWGAGRAKASTPDPPNDYLDPQGGDYNWRRYIPS